MKGVGAILLPLFFTEMGLQIGKEKLSGVYKISNTLNEHFYIGSSKDSYGRWYNHRSALRANRHHSQYLQRAWSKYGEEAFKFEMIEECPKENLLEREQHYIDLLKPTYNVEKKAGQPPVDPERSRRVMKNLWESGKFDDQKRAVERIDPSTGEIKEYAAMSDAEQDGFGQQSISACCLGRKASHGNYFWKFADGFLSESAPVQYQKVFYPVIGTRADPDETMILKSFEECNAGGFNYVKIRACCAGKRGRRVHMGFRWQFLDDYKQAGASLGSHPTFAKIFNKPVARLGADGSVVKIYESQRATRADGFDQRKVSACCLGKRKTHGGFGWKFI